jgi:hypothetical protein
MPSINKNCNDIDGRKLRLVKWIEEGVAQYVPLSKPVSFSVP